jgi:hypothetical protein
MVSNIEKWHCPHSAVVSGFTLIAYSGDIALGFSAGAPCSAGIGAAPG